MAICEQPVHQIAADKASRPGHENSQFGFSFLGFWQ
jgi:hypothetical protein